MRRIDSIAFWTAFAAGAALIAVITATILWWKP